MRVHEIMTHDVRSCRADAYLSAAANLMLDDNCGFVPVVDEGGVVVGVITDRDVCLAAARRGSRADEIRVAEVCSGKVFCCSPGDDVHAALQTMRSARVHRLPVTDAEGRLRGVLSVTDVLLHMPLTPIPETAELTPVEAISTLASISRRPKPRKPVFVSAE
jgi:CBS domain-containing protein